MATFFNLLKIQLISNFKINAIIKKGKKKAVGGFVFLALYALFFLFIFGYAGYTYSSLFVLGYTMSGLEVDFVPVICIMIAISAFVSFFFSFYSISNVLFNFKDYDMLVSMPIKKDTIVLSKLAYLYVVDVILSIFVVIGGLISISSEVALSSIPIFSVFLFAIVSPFFAIVFSIIIGTFFAIISAKFKRKNIVQTILLFAFILAFMSFNFLAGLDSFKMQNTISKIFFIYPLLEGGINGKIVDYILYLAVCIVPAVLIIKLVCVYYYQLNALVNARKTNRKFKLKDYSSKGQMRTLFSKEIKRLFSSPTYSFNCLTGAVLCIIASIVFIILSSTIGEEIALIGEIIVVFIPALIIFTFMVSPTTGCSIAMEGKAFWLLKTSPIKMTTVFNSKILVNTVFYTTSALFVGIAFSVSLKLPLSTSMLVVLFAIMVSLFAGAFGLFANILFPHLTWENENQAVKQGMSILLCVMLSMVLAGVFGGGGFYLVIKKELISTNIFLTICLAFISVLTALFYYVIYKHGEKILDKRIK